MASKVDSSAPMKSRPIEAAGEEVLTSHCENYPQTENSTLLPPVVSSGYPEAHDSITGEIRTVSRPLTTGEQAQLQGMKTNQSGEIGEYKVYQAFHKLCCTKQQHPFLIMHGYTTNDDKKFMQKELIKELPNFPAEVETNFGLDFIILIKHIGVIHTEVKTSATPVALGKAEVQLNTGRIFFKSLMEAIEHSGSKTKDCKHSELPYLRLIVVPNESSSSPAPKTPVGSYVYHQDFISDLPTIWPGLVSELMSRRKAFQPKDFERFAKLVVGLWACKPKPSGLTFELSRASLAAGVIEVDKRVDKQMISSDTNVKKRKNVKAQPLADVVEIQRTDPIRSYEEVNLFYITPQQKGLLDHYQRVIVNGVAGTGKTLMMILKIMDLAKNKSNRKIFLLAPHPILYKYRNIFQANHITSAVFDSFPLKQESPVCPPSHLNVQVAIMEVGYFFRTDYQTLIRYDLEGYDIFIDDIQSHKVPWYHDPSVFATYPEIAQFLFQLYIRSLKHNTYLWCVVDVMQCQFVDESSESFKDRFAYYLLYSDATTPRHLPLPVYTLTRILRNSYEITQLLKEAREHKIQIQKVPPLWITEVEEGHRITGKPITYHRLQQGVDPTYMKPFILQMLEAELNILLNLTHALPKEHIAVLNNSGNGISDTDLKHCLRNTCKCVTQTIKDSYVTPNRNAIIVDYVTDCASVEFPCVVYLCGGNLTDAFFYSLVARARSMLVVIHCDVTKEPITTPHLHPTTWSVDSDGHLMRL